MNACVLQSGAASNSSPADGERSGGVCRIASEGSRMSSMRTRTLRPVDPQRAQKVDTYVTDHEGDNPIYSVLIANNGLAAVKFIQGIRAWSTQRLGNSKGIHLVAMATPNDIRINAEHVQLADQFVEVPGGPNNNNYANVPLIVQVAQRAGVGAVWPGWGHASEIPELPASLKEAGITFLGPGSVAMAALGDKIGSTILAQAAGVPTLPWSGSGVSLSFAECGGVIPEEVYAKACINSVEQATERCNSIGYPVMLKASWGGGGKGIRKVQNAEDVMQMYKQIQGEVPGSPIFAMQFAPTSRHLEVQLLCDNHGNVASLLSRDCSIQRRHQKIVEEGPVVAASKDDLKAMEKCARALARSVGYIGAATVEFLYALEAKKFYFLELNPPQLQVGMGIPLWRIPSVRALYGKDPKGQESFNLEETPQKEPDCHVVAVRITSEAANDGFKPTCGRIDELHFRATPDVWGYFSVKGGGGIHEFSDSQFGHLFARGETRADALRLLVGALKDVVILGEISTSIDYCIDMLQDVVILGEISTSIDYCIDMLQEGLEVGVAVGAFKDVVVLGEISTSIDYCIDMLQDVVILGEISTSIDNCIDMLQCDDFVANTVHTGWLDARIASKVQAGKLPWYLSVIAGAVVRSHQHVAGWKLNYFASLSRGQLPSVDVSLTRFHETLVIDGVKYEVDIGQSAPDAILVSLNDSHVDVLMRGIADGGFLIQVDGTSHVVHYEEIPLGTRIIIGSRSCVLSKDIDPSRLIATSPCKLVRCLVASGTHVEANTPYAEVEVMKMIMPLLTPSAGVIQFVLTEGAVVAAGDLIARFLQSDAGAAAAAGCAKVCTGPFPEMEPPAVPSAQIDQIFKLVFENTKNVMAGYVQPGSDILDDLIACLDSPDLALLQWSDAYSVVRKHIPSQLWSDAYSVVTKHVPSQLWSDAYSVVRKHVPSQLAIDLENIMSRFSTEMKQGTPLSVDVDPLGTGGAPHFPAKELLEVMEAGVKVCPQSELVLLEANLASLADLARKHLSGKEKYARSIIFQLLDDFLRVEEFFHPRAEAVTEQDIVTGLKSAHSNNLNEVFNCVVSHQGLPDKCKFVLQILNRLVMPAPEHYRKYLRRFSDLGTRGTQELKMRAQQLLSTITSTCDALDLGTRGTQELKMRAQQLLEHSLLADLRTMVARSLSGLDMFSADDSLVLAHGLSSPLQSRVETSSSPSTTPRSGIEAKIDMLVAAPAAVEDALVSLHCPAPHCPMPCPPLFKSLPPIALHTPSTTPRSGIEAKIDMLVAAPAAVEDALVSLLIEKGIDRTLRERAAMTYVRRLYHHLLLQQPLMMMMPKPSPGAAAHDDDAQAIPRRYDLRATLVPTLLLQQLLMMMMPKPSIGAGVLSPPRSFATMGGTRRGSEASKDRRSFEEGGPSHTSNVASIWIFNEPSMCSSASPGTWVGVLLIVDTLQQLPGALQAAKTQLSEMGLASVTSVLHIAITGGIAAMSRSDSLNEALDGDPETSMHNSRLFPAGGIAAMSQSELMDASLDSNPETSLGGIAAMPHSDRMNDALNGDPEASLVGFLWDIFFLPFLPSGLVAGGTAAMFHSDCLNEALDGDPETSLVGLLWDMFFSPLFTFWPYDWFAWDIAAMSRSD
eukprot:gene4934-34705_t